VVLDNRFGPWGGLSWEDSLERLQLALELIKDCDYVIVPPIYEEEAKAKAKAKTFGVIDLRTQYVRKFVLPYSVVGKIGLLGYPHHQEQLKSQWNQIIWDHILSVNQAKNKHFQTWFPLYTLDTSHWSILYDLSRSRFVNKLIKTDLKKLKDFAVDTVLPLERGYLKHGKVIKQTFHSKVRWHGDKVLEGLIQENISWDQKQYKMDFLYTWDNILETNKPLLWTLSRGKEFEIIMKMVKG
jgi:hypothetical protein